MFKTLIDIIQCPSCDGDTELEPMTNSGHVHQCPRCGYLEER